MEYAAGISKAYLWWAVELELVVARDVASSLLRILQNTACQCDLQWLSCLTLNLGWRSCHISDGDLEFALIVWHTSLRRGGGWCDILGDCLRESGHR